MLTGTSLQTIIDEVDEVPPRAPWDSSVELAKVLAKAAAHPTKPDADLLFSGKLIAPKCPYTCDL